MTENTYQQIEIPHRMNPQSVDFPRETVQNKENQQFTRRTVNYRRAGFLPFQNTSRKKERKDSNYRQNTHVTLNWLEQLKK